MSHTITQQDAMEQFRTLELMHVFYHAQNHQGSGKRLVVFSHPYIGKSRFVVQEGLTSTGHGDDFCSMKATELHSLHAAVEYYNKLP